MARDLAEPSQGHLALLSRQGIYEGALCLAVAAFLWLLSLVPATNDPADPAYISLQGRSLFAVFAVTFTMWGLVLLTRRATASSTRLSERRWWWHWKSWAADDVEALIVRRTSIGWGGILPGNDLMVLLRNGVEERLTTQTWYAFSDRADAASLARASRLGVALGVAVHFDTQAPST